MKMNDVFPSKFLSAADLDNDTTLTVYSVEMAELKDRNGAPEHKPAINFSEVEKGLILNKTNWKTIEKLYGAESDDWVGEKITLFATEVDFRGETVMAIRVRLNPNPAPAANVDPVTKFWVLVNKTGVAKADADALIGEHAGDFDAAYAALTDAS